ncbi:MAG: hypothetical protein HQL48_05655 [Gammaproteobacteria bacterium]|nr:hypothetical protein [Gammaproteobacteria bacterium]
MMTDTEIRSRGVQVLAQTMGDVEAERFIALIQREPFDYTEWRQSLPEESSFEAFDAKAMAYRNAKRGI